MKIEEIPELKFVVLGAARSGVAAAYLLKRHGADVLVVDSSAEVALSAIAQDMASAGVACSWGNANDFSVLDGRQILVKSPGIPQTNPMVVQARACGMRVISEIELAATFVPDQAKVIAITGTNGKTTTAALTAHLVAGCGFQVILAGNIGDAWANRVVVDTDRPDKLVYVVETSSFQLEDLEDFVPDVAILTNLSPDHMDRYDNRMDLYVQAKENLWRRGEDATVLIWNEADPESVPVAARYAGEKWGYRSDHDSQSSTVGWIEGGHLVINDVAVLSMEDFPLPGKHNHDNALCAALAALAVGARPSDIAEPMKSFEGVEHRIELCGVRKDGVRFYNDSKATNLDAMEKAVVAFKEPIVLIAGGRDAHSDYTAIAHLIRKHVRVLITLGEAAELIESAWGDHVQTQRAVSMEEAVRMANDEARPGEVVVFSPACKSFDMYENFEERGKDFKACVQQRLTRAQS